MKLSDLSDNNRRILVGLKDIHCASRRHIAELTGLHPNQISPALNRLEGMGFIDRPEAPGTGWTMNGTGYALFGLAPPVVEAEANETMPSSPMTAEEFSAASGIPILEPETKPAPVAGPYPPSKSAEIMTAMEIELALEQVRGRLTAPIIPAIAARVYREILLALPKVLVDTLAPITAVVDGHG